MTYNDQNSFGFSIDEKNERRQEGAGQEQMKGPKENVYAHLILDSSLLVAMLVCDLDIQIAGIALVRRAC